MGMMGRHSSVVVLILAPNDKRQRLGEDYCRVVVWVDVEECGGMWAGRNGLVARGGCYGRLLLLRLRTKRWCADRTRRMDVVLLMDSKQHNSVGTVVVGSRPGTVVGTRRRAAIGARGAEIPLPREARGAVGTAGQQKLEVQGCGCVVCRRRITGGAVPVGVGRWRSCGDISTWYSRSQSSG